MKDVEASEATCEVMSPKREQPALQNMNFLNFFYFCWSFLFFLPRKWVAKLVAYLLAIAVLWVRIHISPKNTKWAT